MLVIIIVVSVSTTLNYCDGSYAYLDIEKLHQLADTVVKGTVIDVNTSDDVIYNYLTAIIEVEKYIKNPLELKKITVRSSKQKIGDGLWYEQPDLVNFSIGEKVVVYLQKLTPEFYTTIGASQGKFTLIGNFYINENADRWYEQKPLSFGFIGLVIVGAVILGIVCWKRRTS